MRARPLPLLALSVLFSASACRFDLARLRDLYNDATADAAAQDSSDDAPASDSGDESALDAGAMDAAEEPLDATEEASMDAPDSPLDAPDAAPDAPPDVAPDAPACSLPLGSTSGALLVAGSLLLYDAVPSTSSAGSLAASCLNTGTSGSERIYRYHVVDGTSLTASTLSASTSTCPTDFDTVLSISSRCEATSASSGVLACDDDTANTFGCTGSTFNSLTRASVSPGQDLFVVVDSYLPTGGLPGSRFRLTLTENAVPLAPPSSTIVNPYCDCPATPSSLRASSSFDFPLASYTGTMRTFAAANTILNSVSSSAAPFANLAGGGFEFRLTENTLTGACRAVFDLSYASRLLVSFAVPSPSMGGPTSTILRAPPLTRAPVSISGSNNFTLTLRTFDGGTACSGSVRFDWGRVTMVGN